MSEMPQAVKDVIYLFVHNETPLWEKRPRSNQLKCLELLKESSKHCNIYYIQYNMGKTQVNGRWPRLVYPKLFTQKWHAWVNCALRTWPKGARSASVEAIHLHNMEMIHRLLPRFEFSPVVPAPRAKDDLSAVSPEQINDGQPR